MADRTVKLRKLRQILRRYGVEEDPSRGKGSHVMFFRQLPEGRLSYFVPTDSDVKSFYVKGCRKKFGLTADDGVSDEEFYGS